MKKFFTRMLIFLRRYMPKPRSERMRSIDAYSLFMALKAEDQRVKDIESREAERSSQRSASLQASPITKQEK